MISDALGHSVRQSRDEAPRPCTSRPVKQSTLPFFTEQAVSGILLSCRDSSLCSVWASVLRSVSFRSYNIIFPSKLFPFPLQDVRNWVCQSQALLDSWVAASSDAPTNREFFPHSTRVRPSLRVLSWSRRSFQSMDISLEWMMLYFYVPHNFQFICPSSLHMASGLSTGCT